MEAPILRHRLLEILAKRKCQHPEEGYQRPVIRIPKEHTAACKNSYYGTTSPLVAETMSKANRNPLLFVVVGLILFPEPITSILGLGLALAGGVLQRQQPRAKWDRARKKRLPVAPRIPPSHAVS